MLKQVFFNAKMAGSQSRFPVQHAGFALCSNDFPYPSAFMQATLEDLGQLKRAFRIEVSLEEIKPTYDAVYQRLRNTRLNGFRPGKFPKGWLDKRFKAVMQQEVAGTVIPRYLNQALHDHELSAATQASIEELEFDRRSPLFAKLHFEVKPDLELPDYTKLQLERRTPEEITEKEIDEEIKDLQRSRSRPVAKDNPVVEDGDLVRIDFEGTVDGEKFEDGTNENIVFIIGSTRHPELQPHLLGMRPEETKEVDVTLPEAFGEDAGKTAHYTLILNSVERMELPELDGAFFANWEVDTEEEFRETTKANLQHSREDDIKASYRLTLREQLPALYDDFPLPEALLMQGDASIDQQLEQAEPELSDEDKAKRKEEEIAKLRGELKLQYLLDSIFRKEQVFVDPRGTMEELYGFAQMYGSNLNEFLDSHTGERMYHHISARRENEAVLDRVAARVFGDPVEEAPVHHDHDHDDHDHDHDHDHAH